MVIFPPLVLIATELNPTGLVTIISSSGIYFTYMPVEVPIPTDWLGTTVNLTISWLDNLCSSETVTFATILSILALFCV